MELELMRQEAENGKMYWYVYQNGDIQGYRTQLNTALAMAAAIVSKALEASHPRVVTLRTTSL